MTVNIKIKKIKNKKNFAKYVPWQQHAAGGIYATFIRAWCLVAFRCTRGSIHSGSSASLNPAFSFPLLTHVSPYGGGTPPRAVLVHVLLSLPWMVDLSILQSLLSFFTQIIFCSEGALLPENYMYY